MGRKSAATAGLFAALLVLAGGSLRADESPTVAEADAETRRTVHLLRRATFAPRLEDVEEAKRLGRDAWLERQLHPEGIPDRDVEERLASFDTLDLEPTEYWAMLEARRPPPRVPGRGVDRLEAARARQRERSTGCAISPAVRFRSCARSTADASSRR